jgi:hypothetical protein
MKHLIIYLKMRRGPYNHKLNHLIVDYFNIHNLIASYLTLN